MSYVRFLYWKQRLASDGSGDFVEVLDGNLAEAGITIECQELRICLSKGFDASTLQRLIRSLGA